MWWGQSSGQPLWLRVFWVIIIIAIISEFFTGRNGGGSWWMVFPLFFFVIPMIARYVSSTYGEGEKRKNDAEKPKREARPPQYILSEDGEPLEVIEEDVPGRKQKPDDIEYV